MENFKCKKISVDSVVNDPVDVRAGGPEYLGFDFFVKESELKEMAVFISDTLNEYGVPLENMCVSDKSLLLSEDKVWTKDKIKKCVCRDASYLISEGKRNYKKIHRL